MPAKRIILYIWISLLFIIAIFFILRSQRPKSNLTELVKLPGGAKVLLYDEAKISKMEEIDQKVRLAIDGKLFIEVPTQDTRVYEIVSEEALIRLKTGSAVIDASKPSATELMVSSGEVALAINPENDRRRIREVNILPGEKGIISPNAKGVVKQNIRDPNFKSWVDFKFTFDNEKLEDIVLLLSQSYGVEIVVSIPNVSNCRYTGEFDNQSLEDVLQVLSENLQFEYLQNDEKQWEINGSGC